MQTPKKKVSDRMEALLQKQRQIDEQIKRVKQRDRSVSRKVRNRAMLLIGIAVESQIKQQPAYLSTVRRMSREHLKDRDQEAVNEFLALLAGDSAPTLTPPGAASPTTQPPMPQPQIQTQEKSNA